MFLPTGSIEEPENNALIKTINVEKSKPPNSKSAE
jgi:hypothetical protein